MTSAHLTCSFCSTHQDQVGYLVKGTTSAFICDACILAAAALVFTEMRAARTGGKPANDSLLALAAPDADADGDAP